MCNCQKTTTCNTCNPKPCVTPTPCGCPAGYFSSDCVSNVTAEFQCLNIETGLPLTDTLEALDQAICDKVETITNYISLVNVGDGAEVYKGVNGIGQKQLRTLTSENNSVVIQTNTDTIDFSVNLADTQLPCITSNDESVAVREVDGCLDLSIQPYTVSNVGTGVGVFKNETTGTFNFKSLKSSDNSVIITADTNEIDIKINPTWLQTWLQENSQVICEIVANCTDTPNYLGNFGYSDTLTACGATTFVLLYRDVLDGIFEEATILATDLALTNLAPAGYYSELSIYYGTIVSRYWNGTAFVGSSEVCT